MMMAAFPLCIYVGSSTRKAAKSLEVFNFMFHGLLGDKPRHTTIWTGLAKRGLDGIKHKERTLDEAYASTMDASISDGDRQMILALKVTADHRGKALAHDDEEVGGMAVSENWPASKVKDFCEEMFVAVKNLVANTKHLALKKFAYHTPPKQRSMARLMNMYAIADWAKRGLQN